MRHVSRTHRVALDWLFDRINLDSEIQIRYIDTKHQLADILTKGNFTRDDWNNLLHLFNISHVSSTCCEKNSSLMRFSKTVAKRMQEQKGRRKKFGNIEIYSDELVFSCSDKFLIREKSDCIRKFGDTHSYGETMQDEEKFKIRRSVEFSSATARCIPWRVDGHSNGVDISESETGSEEDVTGEVQKLNAQTGHTIYACLQPQFITRKQYSRSSGRIHGREHEDPTNELDVNMAIGAYFWMPLFDQLSSWTRPWREFTLREENFGTVWDCYSVKLENWSVNKKEITGVCTKDFTDATWTSTSLLCEKAYRITNDKTYVFSYSVLCVGKMGDDLNATWKSKIKWYSENNHFKDTNRIDGMPTEFEWEMPPGITTLGLLEKIQSPMRDLQCKP